MTKEEARNYLLKWIEYATNPESHPFIDAPCSDEEILESMRIGAEALSKPSLPSNLDEAAKDSWAVYEYRESPRGLYSTRYVDGFKSGAEWMAGQGVISEGKVFTSAFTSYVKTPGIEELLKDAFPEDTEVIVQIRKKQPGESLKEKEDENK